MRLASDFPFSRSSHPMFEFAVKDLLGPSPSILFYFQDETFAAVATVRVQRLNRSCGLLDGGFGHSSEFGTRKAGLSGIRDKRK
jgi:hypothetical protein